MNRFEYARPETVAEAASSRARAARRISAASSAACTDAARF